MPSWPGQGSYPVTDNEMESSVNRLKRAVSTVAAVAVAVALTATVIATAGSPAEASLPYCNAVSTVVATDGTGILYPTYHSPWSNGAAPTLSCDMSGLNQNPTTEQKQAIIQIQNTLKNCYGQNISIDGLYGPQTRSAVQTVQSSYLGFTGSAVDGWAGPNTRSAMNHMLQGSTGCKKRNSSGNLSSNQYQWYWRYMSTSAGQPSQVFVGPQPAAPARTDNFSKPVYFVHGYNDGLGDFPTSISGYWGYTIADFETTNGPGALSSSNVVTFCYYSIVGGCTVNIGGTQTTPIKDIAKELAWNIYMRDSRYGRAVDIVAHSMGGLVARAAVTGTANGESGFPPYIFVEDALTIDTPNAGVINLTGALCAAVSTAQCDDMRSGSTFMSWVQAAPSSAFITDWTYLGSDDDPIVPLSTSVPDSLWVEHKVVYDAGQITSGTHMAVLRATSGTYSRHYCDLDHNRTVDPFCENKSSSAWVHIAAGTYPTYMFKMAVFYKDLF